MTAMPLVRRVAPFLLRLMDHAALSAALVRSLGPEDSEAYRFANELRGLTLEGQLDAVWTHPANELAGVVISKGKPRASPQAALARALGLITGTSDYLFLWSTGSGAIEFKSATGRLTDGQKDFRSWCEHRGVPFALVRTVGEALDVLRGWGRIA
jgi:hypothetical protein